MSPNGRHNEAFIGLPNFLDGKQQALVEIGNRGNGSQIMIALSETTFDKQSRVVKTPLASEVGDDGYSINI